MDDAAERNRDAALAPDALPDADGAAAPSARPLTPAARLERAVDTAVVLFVAGVSTKIAWRPAQLTLLALSVVLLVFCTAKLGTLPDGSDWQLTPLRG